MRVAVALLAALAQPALAAALCAPAARSIFPASGIVGQTVVATVTGEALDGGTIEIIGEPGLTATVQASADPALTLRLDLDPAALPGERILFITTPGGTTGVSFTVNPAGGPVVTGASPPLVATRGLPLDVTVTGAGLGDVAPTDIAISGSGVTVASAVPTPDGTTLDLGLAVDGTADLGTHAITIARPLGSVVLQLYVRRPPPLLTGVQPAAGEVGATVPLTLTGTDLEGAALVITGDGVAVGDVTTDATTLTATLAIDAGTPPAAEPRLLIVTTESGQTTAEFFVVAPGVPTVTGIAPGAGEPGETVPVTLHGLGFTGGGVTTPPGDLTLQNVTVVDDETITLDVVVAGGATTGVDHVLTVGVGPDTATAAFRVIDPADPFIGAVRPPFGNRGDTFTIHVEGVNLALVVPGTGVDLSGPKITESNAVAEDDQTVRATLELDPTASVGFRDVTVDLTNGRSDTHNAAFRVNVPGQVPSIDDVSPRLVEPGTTTAITVMGANFAGGSALVTGPGVTVGNVLVDETGTVLTFDLTLDADAPAEDRAVIVVTENGTARCGIASNPSPPELLAARLVKTGARFTVTSSGFRLFVFEFSLGPLFEPGLRTRAIPDADGTLVLDRRDTVGIGQAFRAHHRGWVRVRAVTATNRLASSPPVSIRR